MQQQTKHQQTKHQQTKSGFDWSDPNTMAALLILSAIVAALIIYAIYKGYGNEMAQFAQGMLEKMRDDARDNFMTEKLSHATKYISEHAGKWPAQIEEFIRAHPLPKKWPSAFWRV